MVKQSYTSASIFSPKLLAPDVIKQMISHKIKPLHIQLNPTNICNDNCSFCSCKNKDYSEMPLEQLRGIIDTFKRLGTISCTITGGGEPLCHPRINEIIVYIGKAGIKIGLVTNGISIKLLSEESFRFITWVRISFREGKMFNQSIISTIERYPKIDWSISYVCTNKDVDHFKRILYRSNMLNLTHVRIVNNILEPDKGLIDSIKDQIRSHNIDDHRVIYQSREGYTKGTERCLISLLKPNIDPLGTVYPCCGCQYSIDDSLKFDDRMSMGKDYDDIWKEQSYFNGSICNKCFYDQYNQLMNAAWNYDKLVHKEFF